MKNANKPGWIYKGAVVHVRDMMMLSSIQMITRNEVYLTNGVRIGVAPDIDNPWDVISRFISPVRAYDRNFYQSKIKELKK